jgi:hypothetical protein
VLNFNKRQEKKDKRKVATRLRRHEIVNKFAKHNPGLNFNIFVLFLKNKNAHTFPIALGKGHMNGFHGQYCSVYRGDNLFYFKTYPKVDLAVLNMSNKERFEHFKDQRKVRFMKRKAA